MTGIASSFTTGVLVPMSSIVFRQMVNILIAGQVEYDAGNLDKAKFANGVIFYCYLYFSIGVCTFILSFFGASSQNGTIKNTAKL